MGKKIHLTPNCYSPYIIWSKFASEFLIFSGFPIPYLIPKAYRIPIRSEEENLDRKGPFHTERLSDLGPRPLQTGRRRSSCYGLKTSWPSRNTELSGPHGTPWWPPRDDLYVRLQKITSDKSRMGIHIGVRGARNICSGHKGEYQSKLYSFNFSMSKCERQKDNDCTKLSASKGAW